MSTFIERLKSDWDIIRIMRTAIGLMLMVSAIQSRDWALGLFGIFFLYQGITNTGCCGTRQCGSNAGNMTRQTATRNNNIDVEYEEVK